MNPQPPNPRTVFGRAVELESAAERNAYLDEACAGAPESRARVEALLRAHKAAGGFLQPATGPAGTVSYAPNPEPLDTASYGASPEPHSTAGPYKLLEKIGEGGMGEVWVADQLEPIKRRVALKLIKPGMDSRGVLARFEAERQALALMNHPNIAKVLDAGTTPDGRPYFVMELVKGTPITEFCDARKLTPKERLELFVPVCQAIQHAHQKGVIHRDIKPSNVLVELHDDRSVAKVIDFGVAKAIGQQLTEKTIYTGFGALVGTPAYMAPEQATFNALDVDTRADVYALGVLLYELLAGSPPIEKERLNKAALDEVLRIVRDEEPPRPSQRLSTSQTKASIAATRQSDPAKLSALMKGELDWIVMKALEKDRARRFDTPTALAKDVQRYLTGDSVEACPPMLGYRLRKAYRRNKAAVRVASAFVCLMAGAVLMGAVLTVRATKAERDARAEASRADDERTRTQSNENRALTNEELARREAEKLRISREEQRAAQYTWDMQMIPTAWSAGQTGQIHALLDRHRPGRDGPSDLRGFEWHYWHRQTHAERWSRALPLRLEGWESVAAGSWAVSDDGTRLACVTGPRDSPFPLLGADADPARADQPSRPERELRCRVFDATSGEVVRTAPLFVTPAGWNAAALSRPRLSPDGRRVAAGWAANAVGPGPLRVQSIDSLRVIEVATGKALLELQDPTDHILAHDFSPDGRRFVAVTAPKSRAGGPPTLLARTVLPCKAAVWDLDASPARKLCSIDCVHTGSGILGLAFSPDGATLAGQKYVPDPKGGRPRATHVAVWDANTGEEVTCWPCSLSGPTVLTFSADGKRLAGGWIPAPPGLASGNDPFDLVLTVWDVPDGTERFVRRIPDVGTGTLMRNAVPFFSPDGSRVGVQYLDNQRFGKGGAFAVWDATTGAPVFDARGMTTLSRVRFTPDGKRFVTSDPTTIFVRDAATGQVKTTLRGHTDTLVAVALSADGRRLVSLDRGHVVKEWDAAPVEPMTLNVAGLVGPTSTSNPPALSPDGRFLGVCAPARKGQAADALTLWDLGSGKQHALSIRPDARTKYHVSFLQFTPDGRFFAMFRPAQGRPYHYLSKPEPQVPLPPPSDLTVWDTATLKEVAHLQLPPVAWWGMIAPDGTAAVVYVDGSEPPFEGRKPELYTDGTRPGVRMYNLATGKQEWSRNGVVRPEAAAFSPDGRRFAFVEGGWPHSAQAKLVVSECTTGQDSASAPVVDGSFPSLAWSPDGTRVALGGRLNPVTFGGTDGNTAERGELPLVRVYDARTLQLRVAISHHDTGLFSLSSRPVFSPDGRRVVVKLYALASPESGGAVKLFDATTAKELLSLNVSDSGGHSDDDPRQAFTANGHKLVVCTSSRSRTPPREPGGLGGRAQGGELTIKFFDATPRAEPKP